MTKIVYYGLHSLYRYIPASKPSCFRPIKGSGLQGGELPVVKGAHRGARGYLGFFRAEGLGDSLGFRV